MGELKLLLISTEKDGTWEPEWEPLRGTFFEDLLSKASKENVEHALRKLSRPLVDSLGLPPEGALRKIPVESRRCSQRIKCPFFDDRKCFPEAKNMPWCFEPDGVAGEQARLAATQAIMNWRTRIYLVVVT
jgi:hypothetical protein